MKIPKSNWVVALSPITKIFVPHLQPMLKREKDKIWDEKMAFKIAVQRCDGAFVLDFKKPKMVTDLDLLNYLVGDTGNDTDWTGIVRVPMDQAMEENMSEILAMMHEDPEGAAKKQAKFMKETREAKGAAMAQAKEQSMERVMKATRQVRMVLMKQYQMNEEAKLGYYKPSDSEFLATMVLAEEEGRKNADEKEVADQFARLMFKTSIAGA